MNLLEIFSLWNQSAEFKEIGKTGNYILKSKSSLSIFVGQLRKAYLIT